MEGHVLLDTNMVDFALLRNHHRYHPRLGNRFGAKCQFVHIPHEDGNWRVQQTIQGWQLWNTHHPSIRIPWGSRRYRRLITLGSIFLLVSPTSRIKSRHTTRDIIVQRLPISFAYVHGQGSWPSRTNPKLPLVIQYFWRNLPTPPSKQGIHPRTSASFQLYPSCYCLRLTLYISSVGKDNTRLGHGTSTTFPESGDLRLPFTPRAVFVYCLCGGIKLYRYMGMGYAGSLNNILLLL